MKPVNYCWRPILAALASVSVWLPGLAHAQGGIPGYPDTIYVFDRREVAMLPRYCIYTQHFREFVPGGNNPEEIQRWGSMMGETFHHLHHYCYGLMFFNRATLLAREAHVRRFYLGNAIKEFDYVLQRAPQEFILLPEVLTKKGETFIKQNRGALAAEPLERAIGLKPDYWPPYAYLSDYYRETGDFKRARQILEAGLSAAPDAKGLQRRLSELDAAAAKPKSAPPPTRKQGSAPGG